jgi:hypothetical protein
LAFFVALRWMRALYSLPGYVDRGANGEIETVPKKTEGLGTVEKYYVHFVPAARDAVQARMDTGICIEEQASKQLQWNHCG